MHFISKVLVAMFLTYGVEGSPVLRQIGIERAPKAPPSSAIKRVMRLPILNETHYITGIPRYVPPDYGQVVISNKRNYQDISQETVNFYLTGGGTIETRFNNGSAITIDYVSKLDDKKRAIVTTEMDMNKCNKTLYFLPDFTFYSELTCSNGTSKGSYPEFKDNRGRTYLSIIIDKDDKFFNCSWKSPDGQITNEQFRRHPSRPN